MHVPSKIEVLPTEILEEIICLAVGSSFLGPPSTLASVLCVSRSFSKPLGRENNPNLHARIFSIKFDVGAAARRLTHEEGPALDLGGELVRRCEGMARLRRNSYTRGGDEGDLDGSMKLDLWMAYLMLLENEGKNSLQLIQYAQVDRLSLEFVMPGGRLHDGALESYGWTVDSELNALGLWLFWLTDKERIKNETATQREEILGSLGYIYTGSFKYASTHGPITHFNVTSKTIPLSDPTPENTSVLPIAAMPFSSTCTYPNYYGRKIALAKPLITPPAFLSSVGRLGFHSGLPSGARTPATRAEALKVGWRGATREDYDKFQGLKTQSIDLGDGTSQRHEHDWLRLIECQRIGSRPTGGFKAFTPGMLDGIWDGKWLGVPPNFFMSLVDDAREHKQVDPQIEAPVFQQPMQFRIREHHQRNADGVVPFEDISNDGNGAAALRAWLPDGITMSQHKDQLHICDQTTGTNYTYSTYISMEATLNEALPPSSECVKDLILTAETTEEFGDAWGHEHYVGRVREWDGLMVLVRDAGAGRWVFYGYIHCDHNLVGRWREAGTSVNLPGWEGVWSMTRRSE